MPLAQGEPIKLYPITEAGGGMLREKEKALLAEIIEKLNDLFGGETTDQDQLGYVQVIRTKMLESQTLSQQAINNTKEQFANSPDLDSGLMNAIVDALDAHTAMSTQAINKADVRRGIKDILLNYSNLWETLRDRAA